MFKDILKNFPIKVEATSDSTSQNNPFPNSDEMEDVDDLIGGSTGKDEYKTHKNVSEQEEELPPQQAVPAPINTPPPTDMGQVPQGIDPTAMLPQGGPESPQEVGRIYELKKIHSRLVSIQSYLSTSTDVELIKLKNNIAEALELFRTMISNVSLFKDRLDQIIIMYYKFLDRVYSILSKYYKDRETGKDVRIPD